MAARVYVSQSSTSSNTINVSETFETIMGENMAEYTKRSAQLSLIGPSKYCWQANGPEQLQARIGNEEGVTQISVMGNITN